MDLLCESHGFDGEDGVVGDEGAEEGCELTDIIAGIDVLRHLCKSADRGKSFFVFVFAL